MTDLQLLISRSTIQSDDATNKGSTTLFIIFYLSYFLNELNTMDENVEI